MPAIIHGICLFKSSTGAFFCIVFSSTVLAGETTAFAESTCVESCAKSNVGRLKNKKKSNVSFLSPVFERKGLFRGCFVLLFYCFNNLSNEMLLSLTIFFPRLTDTLTAETDMFNLLDNSVMFIPNS